LILQVKEIRQNVVDSCYFGDESREVGPCELAGKSRVELMPTFSGARPVRSAVEETIEFLDALCATCPVFEHNPKKRDRLPCYEVKLGLQDVNKRK